MLKRLIVNLMERGCTAIDCLASVVPVGPLAKLGCPTGLAHAAFRLEDHWGLNQPPAGTQRPEGNSPRAAG